MGHPTMQENDTAKLTPTVSDSKDKNFKKKKRRKRYEYSVK